MRVAGDTYQRHKAPGKVGEGNHKQQVLGQSARLKVTTTRVRDNLQMNDDKK